MVVVVVVAVVVVLLLLVVVVVVVVPATATCSTLHPIKHPQGHTLLVLNVSKPTNGEVDVGDGCDDCDSGSDCSGCGAGGGVGGGGGGGGGGGPVADDGEWPHPDPNQDAFHWPTLAPTTSQIPSPAPTPRPRPDAIVTTLPEVLPGPPAFYPDLTLTPESGINGFYGVRMSDAKGGYVINGYRYK